MMPSDTSVDFKESLRTGVGRFFYVLAALIFVVGLALRVAASGRQGFMWEAAREFGTFVSVVVAVAFVYERFIRGEERKLYLSDLEEVLRRNFPKLEPGLILFEQGRPELSDKLAVISSAKCEVLEIGIALRTFVSYFETRPASDFRNHVAGLIAQGVVFRCLMLDPDWEFTGALNDDTLTGRIRASIAALMSLKADAGLKFDIRLYRHCPYFAAICVDGDSADAKMFIAPYLYGARKAESPALLISKKAHPVLYGKFWDAAKQLLKDSSPVPD